MKNGIQLILTVLLIALWSQSSFAQRGADARFNLPPEKGGLQAGERAAGRLEERGAAKVKESFGRSEDGAPMHVRFEGSGEVELEQPKRRGNGSGVAGVTFYQFGFRPSLSNSASSIPELDLGGARLGWRKVSSGAAELVIDDGAGQWLSSAVYYQVLSNRRLHAQAELTVRTDSVRGVWDLYLGNQLLFSGLPYDGTNETVKIKSVSDRESSFSNLKVSDSNPLFEDENADGVPDALGRELGVSDRNDIVPGTDMTLLDAYMGY